MSNRIVVVGEAEGDFKVARELIDQSLLGCTELYWVSDDADLDTCRTYRAFDQSQEFVVWGWLDTTDTKDYRLRSRGMFKNDWPSHDVALRIQRAIFHFVNDADFIVVVKDTEANETYQQQLRDVRRLVEKMPVVIGIEHPELECWLLAAFDPEPGDEELRLEQLLRDNYPDGPGIGFDPRGRSHDLIATGKNQAKLSPKRVLDHLTNNNYLLALRGFHRSNHPNLLSRGAENGLADFLSDIRSQLIRMVFNVVVPPQSK